MRIEVQRSRAVAVHPLKFTTSIMATVPLGTWSPTPARFLITQDREFAQRIHSGFRASNVLMHTKCPDGISFCPSTQLSSLQEFGSCRPHAHLHCRPLCFHYMFYDGVQRLDEEDLVQQRWRLCTLIFSPCTNISS
jgi:hypothetical protein